MDKIIPVLVSANSEWEAVVTILQPSLLEQCSIGTHFLSRIEGQPCIFFHSGWGKIATAAATQYIIDHYQPELIVNIGSCGGFAGFTEVGEVLLVTDTIVYDIIERMSDPLAALDKYRSSTDYAWITSPLPSGTRKAHLASADQDADFKAFDFLTKTLQVDGVDWETGSFAWVASRNEIPWLALRAVSDLITPHASETDGRVELWRSRLSILMRQVLTTLPFFFTEFNCSTLQ